MSNTAMRSFRCSDELWARLMDVCAEEGLSVSAWIRRTLDNEASMVLAARDRAGAERVERERLKSVMGGGE